MTTTDDATPKKRTTNWKTLGCGCIFLLLVFAVIGGIAGLLTPRPVANIGEPVQTDGWFIKITGARWAESVQWNRRQIHPKGQWLIVEGEVRNQGTTDRRLSSSDVALEVPSISERIRIHGDATGAAGLELGVERTVAGFSGMSVKSGQSVPLVIAFDSPVVDEPLTVTIAGAKVNLGIIATPTPSPTLTPSNTPSPLPTPSMTATPSITPTSTPVPLARVRVVAANVREGPGTNFPVVAQVHEGDEVVLIVQTPSGDWFEIRTPMNKAGWISADLVEPLVPLGTIPTPSATPTPHLTATAFAKAKASRATATAAVYATATAVIESYRQYPPKGYWGAHNNGVIVVVGDFRYERTAAYQSAGPQSRFVAFTMRVDNKTDSTIHVNPHNVTLVDLDGATYTHHIATYGYWRQPLQAVNVAPGNHTQGGLVFLIPRNTGPAKILYDAGGLIFRNVIEVDLTLPPLGE